jgi:heme/copper-type cytochrome/quinol oxidase subunit 4
LRLAWLDWRSLGTRASRRLDLYTLALLAIIVAAVGLRAHHLGSQSLWVDEVDEGTTASSPLDQFLAKVRNDSGAAPLDYVGLKVVLMVLGRHGTVATRSWAFAMGCLGVWLLYRLARSIFRDRLIGLIAAFMLAFSAFHIYYSQEARFYAFAVVAGTVQLIAFLHALDSRSPRAWLVVALASCAALYTHYFLALLLPIEAVYLVAAYLWQLRRGDGSTTALEAVRQVAMGAASQVVAVAAFVPWLVYALPRQIASGYDRLPPLGLGRFHQVFVVLVGLAPLNSPAPLNPGQARLADVVLGLAAVGFVGCLKARNGRVVLLAAVLALAIPLAWTSDQIGHYFWSERQVIFVLAPLYLLAASGARALLAGARWAAAAVLRHGWLGATSRDWQEMSGGVMAGLALGLAGFWSAAYWGPVHQVYSNGWAFKEDWRGVAEFARQNSCRDTRFWSFINAQYSYGIGYYDEGLAARSRFLFVLPDGTYQPSMVAAATDQPMGTHDWIVTTPGAATTGTPLGTEDALLQRAGWRPIPFAGLTVYTKGIACSALPSRGA